jgi:hypothetical protein
MKDIQKIKEFFSKPLNEGNKEYFKPSIRKDKSNPNFLFVDITYPEGSDVLSVGGSKTMGGQDREEGAAKAMSMGNNIAKKLQVKYNIEDIEVKDLKNGKVEVFAVSDDFTKMASPSLDEAKTAIDMAKKQLDQLGAKYEMSGNKFKPFKIIYKPIGKSDGWYDKFDEIVDLFNLGSAVKQSMSEAKKEDAVDTITMDIPLFLRMLEYSREDAQKDLDLHDVTEKANLLGKERGILSMEDYNEIVGAAEEIDEALLTEDAGSALFLLLLALKGLSGASIIAAPLAGLFDYFWNDLPNKRYKEKMLKLFKDPSKRQEVLDMAKEVEANLHPGQQRYLKGLVNNIGKKKIEDEVSQAYIDVDNFIDDKYKRMKAGKPIITSKDRRIKENIEGEILSYIKDNPIPSNVEEVNLKASKLSSAEYQKAKKLKDFKSSDWKWNADEDLYTKVVKEDLTQRIAETLDKINEELCPAGKAYIKRRQAAGEKSSAYLSGRGVKVCKGQMSGKAKKKK